MENRTVFDTNIWVSYFIGKKTDEIVKMTEKVLFFYIQHLQAKCYKLPVMCMGVLI